jgi:outer membrane protein OmpA-like peptidoglycan-associated protein
MRRTTLDQVLWCLVSGSVVGVMSLVAMGCSAGRPPVALEQARTAYMQAAQNPMVVTNAPVALSEAQESLQRAERTWNDDHDEEEVRHLAYVTTQRVEIAKAVAEHKAAEKNMQQLGSEREQVLITARTREAERAQQAAMQAQQQAALAQQTAEQARQQAQDESARARQLEQELSALQAQVQQTERGTVLTLGDVLFEFDQATLKPGVIHNLYPLVTFLREHPQRAITIEGHTDSVGSDTYNADLSQRRAQTVRSFLIQNGINASRLTSHGLGEGHPVASNDTAAGRQLNRRVEITIARQ